VYNYWQRMVVVTVVVVDKLTSSSLVKVMVRDRGRYGTGWFLRGGQQLLRSKHRFPRNVNCCYQVMQRTMHSCVHNFSQCS